MATFIRLNAPSVRTYEGTAEEQFSEISTTLGDLMTACNEVNYTGMNATSFKKQVATAAHTMGTEINKAMTTFFGAVASATTAVAQSLGGSPLILNPKMKALPEVSVAEGSADEQQVDTNALGSLQVQIEGYCGRISGLTMAHASALRGTDWEGDSKVTATTACASMTSTINTAVSDGLKKMKEYIQTQTEATQSADSRA
jgi:hypothetical protein